MNLTPFAQILLDYDSTLEPLLTRLTVERSLAGLVMAAWHLARAIAVRLLEETLNARGQEPDGGYRCPVCGQFLENKGFKSRTILTFVGSVRWRRRIRTCSPACEIGQIVPSDVALGIVPYQQTSWEVQRLGCLLVILMPCALACEVLKEVTGVRVWAGTLWNWIQDWGAIAKAHLQASLEALAAGQAPQQDALSAEEMRLPLLLGADGVMVAFRPQQGTAQDATRWREVKVGILARLTRPTTPTEEVGGRLVRRRVVAVLGDIDALRPRLGAEALTHGILSTSCVVWLSDGGRGFWRLFQEQFAPYADGILDFYHAAHNLWKGAKAWFDGRTVKARAWVANARHRLRHGEADAVHDDIKAALRLKEFPPSVQQTLSTLSDYLTAHHSHLDYARWKDVGIPIGSGMGESACKWLIQQRFKGVGMRWSEDGFNHLLHLRLLWANARFDDLFALNV